MKTNSALENFILFLGPYKWPLAFLLLVVVALVFFKSYQYLLLRKPARQGLNAILFWGVVASALGLTGQIHGIWLSLNAIISVNDISPPLLLVGFLSTFSPTLFGMAVGLLAALAWWGLRSQQARLERNLNHKTKIS